MFNVDLFVVDPSPFFCISRMPRLTRIEVMEVPENTTQPIGAPIVQVLDSAMAEDAPDLDPEEFPALVSQPTKPATVLGIPLNDAQPFSVVASASTIASIVDEPPMTKEENPSSSSQCDNPSKLEEEAFTSGNSPAAKVKVGSLVTFGIRSILHLTEKLSVCNKGRAV